MYQQQQIYNQPTDEADSYRTDLVNDEERKEYALQKAEDVIWQLPRSLERIKREDFNPVILALQMMDTSSLGKSYDDFCHYYSLLNNSLDGIVDEYYGGFNDSILTFSGLHDRIQGASSSVNHVKGNLHKVRRMLLEEHGSLDQLYTKSKQLGEIVTILDRIEEVKKLPDEISGFVQEKKFLTAASKLVQDTQFVFDPEFNPIEGLVGLRQQLGKEKSNLLRNIIDELNNHIYLKSPYCERKMGIESEEDGQKDPDAPESTKKDGAAARKKGRIGRKVKRQDDNEEDNPETDSFAYVEMLLESLVTLDNTSEAMQEIKSSIGLELSNFIDGIIAEVEERNRTLIDKLRFTDNHDEMFVRDTDREVLFDFTRILFARLETVMEYHDFVLEVVHSLDRRERYSVVSSASLTPQPRRTRPYTISDVWSAIKTEVLSILKDYLVPEDKQSVNGIDLTRTGGMKSGIKDLFHMENNAQLSESVDTMYSQIEKQFRDMTAFMPNKKKEVGLTAVIDEYSDQQNNLQHRMLVEANIEHAPILLNAALSFTKRISPLLSSSTGTNGTDTRRTLTGESSISRSQISQPQMASMSTTNNTAPDEYLQIFFKKIFLPRADLQAMKVFATLTSAGDSFQIDPSTFHRGKPVFRSASALVPLLRGFNRLLTNLSMIKGDNRGILLQILSKYYDRCWTLFRDTIRSPDNQVYTSVKWSDTPDMHQLFDRRMKHASSSSSAETNADTEKEIRIEEKLKTERSLHLSELIFDVKRLVTIAQLHQTLEWLLTKLRSMRAVLVDDNDKTTAVLIKKHEADQQKIVNRYQALSIQCLMVLRIEVRAHCTYYLDLATREGDYFLENEALEPDQYIQALNADISAVEEKMESCLPADELNLVFGGISILMSHLLIANTRYIKSFNACGNRKMLRNILALQQNLTNIALSEEGGLDQARKYYETYDLGVDGILKSISDEGPIFTFDSYRNLIEFIYSSDSRNKLSMGRASSLTEARLRDKYEEHIRRLRELLSLAPPASPTTKSPRPPQIYIA